jgi:hypothetical protein
MLPEFFHEKERNSFLFRLHVYSEAIQAHDKKQPLSDVEIHILEACAKPPLRNL